MRVPDTVIEIAVVEDEPHELSWLRRTIEDWQGFRCGGAFLDAESALKQIPRLRPSLVVVDLGLPRMDGIRCIWRLRSLLPGCEILVHSVETRVRQVFHAIQAGATGYVVKGATPPQLHEAVRILLAGGSVLSPCVARLVLKRFQISPGGSSPAAPLSQREMEVLWRLVRGYRNDEVGRDLGISVETVKTHVRHIYEALQVHSRSEVIAWWHDHSHDRAD